jgi:hypothetical protein
VDEVSAGIFLGLMRFSDLITIRSMENFITGYPGHEQTVRAAMLEVMGQDNYDYFFDRWLYWFFNEDDAAFLKSLGINCIRIPFNYRHFEDDMNPRVLKTSGFKHLDRVVDLCAAHGIYSILDMHALPGCQSGGWHSDNVTAYASFWDHKDFQDRTVWLWEQLALQYKDNPWVAGYNPINEPADPLHHRLPAFYSRLEKAIRIIDPDHILWLDGNSYAMEWREFEEYPNSVYSIHDYSTMGFNSGEPYRGTQEQKESLEAQYLRKSTFQRERGLPIWNGEFGPVYVNPRDGPESEKVNQARYELLSQQLSNYDRYGIPWTIWLYKDIGLQGMVYTSPESAWNELVEPMVQLKRRLQLDQWGRHPSEEVAAVIDPLIAWIDKVSPSASKTYPLAWGIRRHVECAVLHNFLAESFVKDFAELFRGKSKKELETLAKSFSFDECKKRDGLNNIMAKHAKSWLK